MTNINNWPTNPEGKPLAFYGARKLGEVAKIVTGKLNANQAVRDGTYPFYTCADEILRINKTAFDGESILVAGNGDFWVKYHESGLFNAYQRTYVIQNEKDKEAITKYLYYSVSLQTPKFKKMAQGGIIKFLHLEQLQNLKIPIPPLKIQKQIVERLDAIKKAQELNDKQIALANELFQSLLHRELNPKGKNWEVKKLENLVLDDRKGIKIGPFGSALKIGELVEKGSVRVIYIENVVNNEFDWSKEKYITGEKYKGLTVYTVNPSDILVTIMGTIGRVCIVPQNIGKAIISSHLIKITPNKKIISSEFLYFSLLGSSFIKKQIIDQATGAIMSGLNSTILRNLKIPLPPLKIQGKIVEKLSAVQDYKKKLLEQKQKLQELFESVLNKSMKRELVK